MFDNIEAIFLDLDGTLVDSVPDLTVAVDAMLAQLGLPPRGEERVRQWVGNGAEMLIRRALVDNLEGNAPDELVAQGRPIFNAVYQANLAVGSRLYPGVLEGLRALQALGYRMACITNKPTVFAKPLVEQLGIAVFFDLVLGGECAPRKKPAPDALLLTAGWMGVDTCWVCCRARPVPDLRVFGQTLAGVVARVVIEESKHEPGEYRSRKLK